MEEQDRRDSQSGIDDDVEVAEERKAQDKRGKGPNKVVARAEIAALRNTTTAAGSNTTTKRKADDES